MEAAHTSAPEPTPFVGDGEIAPAAVSQDANLRRCLATGEMLPKTELLRFVVGPDQTLYPDLAQNLPGRGLWVSASVDAIATAAKKNLFAKAAKTAVKVPTDLVSQVSTLLHKRCMDFLGLSRRTGMAVLGQIQVEGELKAGKLKLLLLADDATADFSAYKAMRNLKTSRIFTRKELGSALGHEQLVYVGFKPHAMTEKLQNEIERLEKLIQPQPTNAGNGQ